MKKTLLKAFMLILTLVFAFSLLTACDSDKTTPDKLENEYGIVVDGGGFDKGAIIVSEVIETDSDEGKTVLEAIKDEQYNKDASVYVYDISVTSDGVKVQPDGKVKVSIPVGDVDLRGYDVLHIKSDGTVERLSATFANGKVTFETDSFSIFVLVEKTYVFLAQCETNDGGYITENGEPIDFGNGKMVGASSQITLTAVANTGYKFKGWGTRDEDWNLTIISTDATHTFTVDDSSADEDGKYYVQAVFEEAVLALKLDAHNAGFTYNNNGELVTTVYILGSEIKPNIEYVGVYATYLTKQNEYLTINEDYTRDLGGLNLTKEGTYTVTYTYTANTSLTATLTVQVVDGTKANGLKLDAHNAGFTYNDNGELVTTVYILGSEIKPNIEYVGVYATYYAQEDKYLTLDEDYTRDLGGLDFTKEGTYTVTYTYSADTSLTVSLTVQVVSE